MIPQKSIALRLASQGWHVFPLFDDRFLVKWTATPEEGGATTSRKQITEWWTRWPDARIGVHCGRSGLVAVDIDRKNDKDGFEALEKAGRDLPSTFHYASRSGRGEHHIYRAPEGVQLTIANSVHGMQGVDIRSGNGLVVYSGGLLSPDDASNLSEPPEWAIVHKKEGDYDAADVEAWLEAERKPEPTNASLEFVERVPLKGVQNGDLIPLLTPIVRTLRRKFGRRKAYEAALERYVGGYPWPDEDGVAQADGPKVKYIEAFDRAFGKAITRLETEWQKKEEQAMKTQDESTEEGTGTPAKASVYEVATKIYEAGWETKITPDGRPFAVDKSTGRATRLSESGRSGSLYSLLQMEYIKQVGRPGSVEQMTQVLQTQHAMAGAGQVPTAELNLRSARVAPDRVVLDLAERHNSAHVEITPKGWTVRDTPPEEAIFELSEASRPLPRPERPKGTAPGAGYTALRKLLGWRPDDHRWLLVRGWLVAALLPNVARPLLFLHGRAGSGKSLRGVFVLSVLDPRQELGGNFAKNERDSLVAAGARFLVGWDNITTVSEAISNMICRLVTGGTNEHRSMYTDDDLFVRDIRRTGVLTGINIPIMLPDALERIIPIECDTIAPSRRQSEAVLREAFANAHPAILADVLDDVSKVLGRLPGVQGMKRNRARMADFSDVLRALGREYDTAYKRAVHRVRLDVAESDPFVQAFCTALRENPDLLDVRMKAETLLNKLKAVIPDREGISGYPAQPNQLSRLLTKQTASIEAMGFSVKHKLNRGVWYWTFAAKKNG